MAVLEIPYKDDRRWVSMVWSIMSKAAEMS